MKTYKITEEQIKEINLSLNNRNTLLVKNLLKELPEFEDNTQEILDNLKKISRETGRSNSVDIQKIEEIIIKYGEKK